MIPVLNILLLLLLGFTAFRIIKINLSASIFWFALSLKLMAGLLLGWLFYEVYESGDTIVFFERAKDLAFESKEPRTNFFITLIRPLVRISGESYWITSLWLSFVSFLASWYCLSVFLKYFPSDRVAIIISLLFIPSIIFWSSGILKDTIASAALMVLVANFIMVYKQLKIDWKNILMIAVTGFVLIKIKHYLAIAAIFFAGILIAHMVFKRFKTKWGFLLGIALLCTAMTATQLIHPYLNVERLPWVLYENNQAIISKTKDTSNTGILIEGNDWSSILSQIPKALLTGLFRPSINDSIPAYGVIHQIENMILGSLLIMSLIIALKKKIELDKPLLVASISAILLLAVLLSLSTPNFGSLVRYKNAYMPFLFIISSVLPFRYLTSKALNK